MNKTFNVVRAVTLLGAVGVTSMFLGLGSSPAGAGEQRLHNEFSATYGLIPLSEGSGNVGVGASMKATKTSASISPTPSKGASNKPDEPKREDPELPGYEGNSPDGPTAMKNG